MKQVFFLALCLIAFSAYSQDWMPFQQGQKSYYSYESNDEILVDDFEILASSTEGGQTHYTFHEIQGLEEEISESNQQELIMFFFYEDNHNFIDAVLKNDSLEFNFYYEWDEEYISTLFKPFSGIGESWTSDDYTITCDTIIEETFYGITDSIKIFTYENTSGDSGQIKLSKHHGFLNFCWFLEYTEEYTLIGLHGSDFSYGFSAPEFHDFFTYMPEDIMYISYHSEPYDISQPSTGFNYKDSITGVYISEDTIIYDIHRWSVNYSGVYESDYSDYHFSGCEGRFLTNELGWIGITNVEDYPDIFHTEPLALEIQGDDTIITMSIRKNLCEYHDNSIQLIPDASTDITYKKGLGETYRIVSSSGGIAEIELIGGVIDGHEWGTPIVIGINEVSKENITVFPNPCQDKIQISGIDNQFTYQIIDNQGKIIFKGKSVNTILTNQLSKGIYQLEINVGNTRYSTKLIKQ